MKYDVEKHGLLNYHLSFYSFEEFQDVCCGGILGYRNGRILAVLNLHVSPMPSNKF